MGNSPGTGLPEDAIEVLEMKDWKVFYSKANDKIYIYPDDYKPGSLGLTKEDLLALIRVLENGRPK